MNAHAALIGRFAIVLGLAGAVIAFAIDARAEPPPPARLAPASESLPQLPPAAPAISLNEPMSTGTIGDAGANAAEYCENIADAAGDARYARQSAALEALQKDIDERIARMEAKRAEYEDWLGKREAFMRKTDERIVAIYSQMRPDAAAAQMAIMETNSAAGILAKLNPRMASAILNEMNPAKAAQLTNVMAGTSIKDTGEVKS